MTQSLLDDQSSPPEDDKEARLRQLEKTVNSLDCELALLRQHMDNGFALVRSDMAARFAESDLKVAERFAEAERKNAERFAEIQCEIRDRFAEARHESDERVAKPQHQSDQYFSESTRRQDDNMKALAGQLQAQILDSEKRQEARLLELSRRLDAFSRWMVGLTVGMVVLVANLATRLF